MPTLGADMEAGTLVEWLKKPGDVVARGDIIAVVDTEKGAIEIEVFDAGVIDRLLIAPGQKTPVGTILAMIRAPGEPPGVAPEPVAGAPPAVAARARISPAARKAAGQLGVDLDAVEGRGPGGSITVADVERAVSGRRTVLSASDRLAATRAAVGAAMARSKRDVPHVYLSNTVDLTPALTWLRAENARRAVTERLLPAVLFIKAVGRACADVPGVNGFWTDKGFAAGSGVHVGCAIALRGGGLVAPALHDVNTKSLDVIGREFADLVARARAGALRSSEMSDPTITVTNLGELGVESVYAIIYPPQVAIVGIGRIVDRPWVVEGRIEPRSVVTVSVSADHRAVDGRGAGAFLTAVERWLQEPAAL
ncbi:MAG: dihydrolipoamide acetyltransferase family protein [Vicinamibacterales bacterium]|nr:dihydrolipoamide acetyltransferase family protein [Vicinamibacterales bacterium]